MSHWALSAVHPETPSRVISDLECGRNLDIPKGRTGDEDAASLLGVPLYLLGCASRAAVYRENRRIVCRIERGMTALGDSTVGRQEQASIDVPAALLQRPNHELRLPAHGPEDEQRAEDQGVGDAPARTGGTDRIEHRRHDHREAT